MRHTILLALLIIASVVSQKTGGMAELKSITGDAPYTGVGNAPAPIPQPMGFWGRPKYAPNSIYDGLPYPSGWGAGFGGAPMTVNRYTSISRSPYGLGEWYENI